MNNKQFVAELAQRLGYTEQDTQKMMYTVVDAMADMFQEGNTIAVQSFGNFEVRKKMERIIQHPATGQRMLVPPKLTLGFKMSTALKDRLNNGEAE